MTSTIIGVDAGYENRWEAEKIALELHDTLLTTARTVENDDVRRGWFWRLVRGGGMSGKDVLDSTAIRLDGLVLR